ncbi:MAG: hypothetical protein K8J08_06630 [Thermoanaerobaculia bacterium]|nr:hypothetical protein [Thermoanaerobaculia bacterium]
MGPANRRWTPMLGEIKGRFSLLGVLIVGTATAGSAESPPPKCQSVILLDLDGDGLFLSDASYSVEFDLDGDGTRDRSSWTASGHQEAFLWRDYDHDGKVDDGRELLCGREGPGASSFEQFRGFDAPASGGNGDGWFGVEDREWAGLELWIDLDHNGKLGRREHGPPGAWGVSGIQLDCDLHPQVDGNLNLYTGVSTFRRTEGVGGRAIEVRLRRTED